MLIQNDSPAVIRQHPLPHLRINILVDADGAEEQERVQLGLSITVGIILHMMIQSRTSFQIDPPPFHRP
jgi:hypothetical protein